MWARPDKSKAAGQSCFRVGGFVATISHLGVASHLATCCMLLLILSHLLSSSTVSSQMCYTVLRYKHIRRVVGSIILPSCVSGDDTHDMHPPQCWSTAGVSRHVEQEV